MDSQICKDYPLLRPICLDVLQESQYSETSIQSFVKLGENAAHKYELLLSGELILLCSAQSGLSTPFAYARIGLHLKFQKIETYQGISKPKLAGFRLLDDFNQEVTFFIEFPELAAMWVDALGKLINQVGFHKQFKPVRTLGKGSSATVYEIVRLSDGMRFAAKTFSKETIKSHPQKLNSFINELEILRNLDHKHLLKVEGVYQSDSSYYVLMEILSGGNLLEHLVKRKKGLTMDEIKQLMRAILSGLEELDTSGIIHRDIKLENLMLRNKNSLEPVIVDFGLAVYADDQDYVYYQCGTPGYLSPEILKLQKGETLHPTSDIFSAGVVLHVLMTGRYLFEGKEAAVVFANNKSLTFDLNKQEYQHIDKPAMDLMKKMLSIGEGPRISAHECLQHEFLRSSEVPQQLSMVSPATSTDSYTF